MWRENVFSRNDKEASMSVVIVTGSAGLIGGECVRRFARDGHTVVGIDNDMRSYFFGDEASTLANAAILKVEIEEYHHRAADIRDIDALEAIFEEFAGDISLIIHTAAQPSHDWAAKEPITDFTVNAFGTLNLLECARKYAPDAVFVFTSTNKVYGDRPNSIPLLEMDTRWEPEPGNHYLKFGIDEEMSIDQSKHSVFGASKVAADVMVQEYGRYFGMKTTVFRGGCLTGPNHAGAELHGFLAYLMKCCVSGTPYRVFGYSGKQVRDNIHAEDFVEAIWYVSVAPGIGEVYNMGGSRHSNCSMVEAIALCEEISGKKLQWSYEENARSGDHIWWISDVRKFQSHYPGWRYKYDLKALMLDIFRGQTGGSDGSV